MADCISGYTSELWVEPGASAHTFDASSEHYEFVSETLGKKETRTTSDGNRNTRSQYLERDRITRIDVDGSIEFPMYVELMELWLSRILGGTETTNTWLPTNDLPAFGVLVKRFSNYYTYSDCVVSKAIIKGASGGNVSLTLEVVGLVETLLGSAPAGIIATYGGTTIAYETLRFSDSLLTVNSQLYKMEDFELTIDNMVVKRFANSSTAVCVTPTDRVVTLRCNLAGSTNLPINIIGNVGHAGALVLANGSVSTTINMPKLVWPQDTPTTTQKGLLDHPVTFVAKASGATPEISITNDNTV